MAISENKAIHIENLRGALLSRGEQISNVLQKVAESSHYSGVQRKDFDEKIKPILIELNRFVNDLKNTNLESFIDEDLKNLFACISSDIHNDLTNKISSYMKIKVDSQVAANKSSVILKEIRDIYNKFLYGVKLSPDWENSFINIINKKNSLDKQDVYQANQIISTYDHKYNDAQVKLTEAESKLRESSIIASNLINKSDELFKQKSVEDYIAKYEDEAKSNLGGLKISIGLLIVLTLWFMFCVIEGLGEVLFNIDKISDHQFYLLLLKSFLVSSVFITFIVALLRASFAFIHNYLMNREKASALFSFDKFFTVHDHDSVKIAATLEVTKTVLGYRSNGFLNHKNEIDNDIELVKIIKDNLPQKSNYKDETF